MNIPGLFTMLAGVAVSVDNFWVMLNEQMAKSEGTVSSYFSLSKLGKESTYDDNFITFRSDRDQITCSSGRKALKHDCASVSSGDYNHYFEYDSAVAGNDNANFCDEHNPATAGNSNLYDEYDSADDDYISAHPPVQPEVNLKNVFSGIVAILTGRNKGLGVIPHQQDSGSTVESIGPDANGVCGLDPSVCAPSAPLLSEQDALDHRRYRYVLEENPPEWVPDSCAPACRQCKSPFTALTRGRHHCRFCGQIFCSACTKGRCLLPNKFRMRDPQRVCDDCYNKLDPVQPTLRNFISNAAQSAKHDVMDWTCFRGWLNLPVGLSMEHEIYKAANTLRSYCQVARLNPEKSIPQAVLKGASGLAILTVAKAGALLTYKLGTGLVASRRADGSWSAPSAIFSVGLGWGVQIGGELMDFIIVLHGRETVKTFCSRMHFSLGAGLSAAAGPVGRVFEAGFHSGDRGSGLCYTYSCSKGAFVGVSLEGSIVATRTDTNLRFYGNPYQSTTDILLGTVERPLAAEPLYLALKDLYANFRC